MSINIVDINFLLCYLEMEVDLNEGLEWDKEMILPIIDECKKEGSILILLPLMIEVGNIIGHDKNIQSCEKLIELMKNIFKAESPWRDFNEQQILWKKDTLRLLLSEWRKNIHLKVSLGDFSNILFKDYYMNQEATKEEKVEIWNKNEFIETYANYPISPILPRKRKRESRY